MSDWTKSKPRMAIEAGALLCLVLIAFGIIVPQACDRGSEIRESVKGTATDLAAGVLRDRWATAKDVDCRLAALVKEGSGSNIYHGMLYCTAEYDPFQDLTRQLLDSGTLTQRDMKDPETIAFLKEKLRDNDGRIYNSLSVRAVHDGEESVVQVSGRVPITKEDWESVAKDSTE